MEFPSLGSIITRELGARGNIPPYIIPKMGTVKYEEVFNGQFIGSQYDPMVIPDPSQEDFRVPDLSLPQSISVETPGGPAIPFSRWSIRTMRAR